MADARTELLNEVDNLRKILAALKTPISVDRLEKLVKESFTEKKVEEKKVEEKKADVKVDAPKPFEK